jgi:hypothetical protein
MLIVVPPGSTTVVQVSVKTPENGQALLGALNGGPHICYLSFHRHMHGSHQVASGSAWQNIEAHIKYD